MSPKTFDTKHIELDDIDTPAIFISSYIKKQLRSGNSVLWLVSGGSSMRVAVRARQLIGELTQDSQLNVGLIDERYVAPKHKNSNLTQLIDAGFDTTSIRMHPVLGGGKIDSTTKNYAEVLKDLLENSNVVVGLFGMGADGHTAGLLPDNPIMDLDQYAGHYEGADYERISVTPSFIRRIDQAVLYAIGENKWPAISSMYGDSSKALPVSALKQTSNLVVFSDYRGAKI